MRVARNVIQNAVPLEREIATWVVGGMSPAILDAIETLDANEPDYTAQVRAIVGRELRRRANELDPPA